MDRVDLEVLQVLMKTRGEEEIIEEQLDEKQLRSEKAPLGDGGGGSLEALDETESVKRLQLANGRATW